jgi:hypothetical protein
MSRKRKPTIDGNALIRTKAFAPRRFMTEVNRLREQGATDGEIVAAMAASKVAAGAARPSRQELTGHDDRAAMTILLRLRRSADRIIREARTRHRSAPTVPRQHVRNRLRPRAPPLRAVVCNLRDIPWLAAEGRRPLRG